jgi:cytochrome c556
MFKYLSIAAVGVALVLGVTTQSGPAIAAEPFAKEIKARKAVMQLYSFNLGKLGAMAKGKMAYDAKKAQAAADNLAAVANLQSSAMWPKGSDNVALGKRTRAKPEAWTKYPMIAPHGKALKAATAKMASVAGNGVDAIKANMKAIGMSCGGCHKIARGPK